MFEVFVFEYRIAPEDPSRMLVSSQEDSMEFTWWIRRSMCVGRLVFCSSVLDEWGR
jgi:hypothetical protein